MLLPARGRAARNGGGSTYSIVLRTRCVMSGTNARYQVMMIEADKPLDSVLGVKSRVRNLQNALEDAKSQPDFRNQGEFSTFVPVNSGGEWDGGDLSKRGAPEFCTAMRCLLLRCGAVLPGFKLDVDKVRQTLAGSPGTLRYQPTRLLRHVREPARVSPPSVAVEARQSRYQHPLMDLRARYAMSGTDIGLAARREGGMPPGSVLSKALRGRYAMSGNDIGYAATRS
eukprot:1987580-Rhodomonas_salina.1